MSSLDKFAADKLATLEKQALKRELCVTTRHPSSKCMREGKELISFSCNDYLGLTHHPEVIEAAREATKEFGAGSGASQLITGHSPLIAELEKSIASLKETESAAIFSSGYMANIGIIPTFVGKKDIIFADELSHACLWQGCVISGAKTVTFRHNDMPHLEELIKRHRSDHPHAMIITDGVFSMDGDIAPLDTLSLLAKKYDLWLLSDDAHGVGVMGKGRGSRHQFMSNAPGKPPFIDLQMGTFSKALGSFGGYLCASKEITDLIKTRSRSLVFTTALPPSALGASLKALEIIKRDHALCSKPIENAQIFTKALGLPLATSPIVPLIIGKSSDALKAADLLKKEGFLVTAIRPPTVPEGTSRLRFAFNAPHLKKDILRLVKAIQQLKLLKTQEKP